MFWIAPAFRAAWPADPRATFEAMLQLEPTGDFHEKQGRSTGRYLFPGPDGPTPVYVKKYRRLPLVQRLFGRLRHFPGPLELAQMERVAALGIAVPEPVAAGADRRHSTCRSFLAIRELTGFVPLHLALPPLLAQASTVELRAQRKALARRIAEIARRLHAANLYHRDLYLCHFFVRFDEQAADGFELALIDFTRLLRSSRRRWLVKDLAQLLFSADLRCLSRTDKLRCAKAYFGLKQLDAPAKRLLREVMHKAERYRRHNKPVLSSRQSTAALPQ